MGWRHLRRHWDENFGESAETVATGNPVLSHPPNGGSHHAQADHFPLSSSSLRGNNSPAPKKDSALALWCLSLTAEHIETRLITKEHSHRHKSLAKAGQSGLETHEESLETEAWG